MRCLFAGCPLVKNRGLKLAVEYCPGRESIERWWFNPIRAGPCAPAAFVFLSAFCYRQPHVQLPMLGSQVV